MKDVEPFRIFPNDEPRNCYQKHSKCIEELLGGRRLQISIDSLVKLAQPSDERLLESHNLCIIHHLIEGELW